VVIKVEYIKFKIVSYGHKIDIENDFYLQSDGFFYVLEHLDSIKDSDVTFDSDFKFNHHVNEKVNKFMQFWV